MDFHHWSRAAAVGAAIAGLYLAPSSAQAAPYPVRPAMPISVIASTVPQNGDVNPYGVAVVPASNGDLVQGDVLISNFNNAKNLQGTGTTIVQISPTGKFSTFAQIERSQLPNRCPGGIGLTTALAVTRTGWVFVGSLPTTNGMSPTAQSGCILVLNSTGKVVETIYGSLVNGPWDMTAFDGGSEVDVFFTDVLNGTVAAGGHVVHAGTVVRMNLSIAPGMKPHVNSMTVIGSGFPERTDPAALVIGPTGLGLSPHGAWLYVADSLDNRVAAIPSPFTRMTSAGMGATVTSGIWLNDPLGLTVAPDGDILTVNGDDGYFVRTTPAGQQVQWLLLDDNGNPPGSGALFGLAPGPMGSVYFVDDDSNTLNLLH